MDDGRARDTQKLCKPSLTVGLLTRMATKACSRFEFRQWSELEL